jgi:hypothetical protein
MLSILAKLSIGLSAVGNGLDVVLLSMVPSQWRVQPNTTKLFFHSDSEALQHDWQCICGDMQAVCQDLKDGVNHVF